jgi:hypothetical protein
MAQNYVNRDLNSVPFGPFDGPVAGLISCAWRFKHIIVF